ncbi:helix-turn-helix transcriptional regulator [bacterium SCSIO 12741]|nr:helix-turn-helix transcriptional regulator [bacterium SCSIO 12741]
MSYEGSHITCIRIKELIERKKLSSEKLANIAGVSVPSINNYRWGKRIPRADLILRLSEHFNLSPNWFFGVGSDDLDVVREDPEMYKNENRELRAENTFLKKQNDMSDRMTKELITEIQDLEDKLRRLTKKLEEK